MLVRSLFYAAILIGYVYMLLLIWSIISPERRIWPPGEVSWKLYLVWGMFYLGAGLTVALIFLDWNTWTIPAEMRYAVGIPLALLGTSLVVWGVRALGMTNTHGVRDGFVARGPYRFTRNPQYLGDIILFTGAILIANSARATVILLLFIFSFILFPLTEEPWLEEQYGEDYLHYKTQTPRFL